MKVCIITFHRSYNYGSALQAFALQKYINANIADAKVIDYIQPNDFRQYKLFRIYLYFHNPKALLEDLLYLKKNYRRKQSFEKFISNNIPLTRKKYTSCEEMKELNYDCDAFICGSDQIWNFVCTDGVEPSYLLGFVAPDKLKISYAPSIAHLNVKKEWIKAFSTYLSTFDHISVREKSHTKMIENAINKKINIVLDPTLLLNKNEYIKLTSTIENKETNYIFLYMLEYNFELLSYANDLSNRKNMHIIYISKKDERLFQNSRNVYGVSPNEFLFYIMNADYIITNSFHATVFSIIFEKMFCTFKTEKSSSRMVDLLTTLSLETKLYRTGFNIDDAVDYCLVKNNLKVLKKSSINFLNESLKETNE